MINRQEYRPWTGVRPSRPAQKRPTCLSPGSDGPQPPPATSYQAAFSGGEAQRQTESPQPEHQGAQPSSGLNLPEKPEVQMASRAEVRRGSSPVYPSPPFLLHDLVLTIGPAKSFITNIQVYLHRCVSVSVASFFVCLFFGYHLLLSFPPFFSFSHSPLFTFFWPLHSLLSLFSKPPSSQMHHVPLRDHTDPPNVTDES